MIVSAADHFACGCLHCINSLIWSTCIWGFPNVAVRRRFIRVTGWHTGQCVPSLINTGCWHNGTSAQRNWRTIANGLSRLGNKGKVGIKKTSEAILFCILLFFRSSAWLPFRDHEICFLFFPHWLCLIFFFFGFWFGKCTLWHTVTTLF